MVETDLMIDTIIQLIRLCGSYEAFFGYPVEKLG